MTVVQVVRHEGSHWTKTFTIVSMEGAEDVIRTDRDGTYRVKWTEQLELDNTIQIELPGIPEPISVIAPKILNARFPSRMRMQFHPSWQKLRDNFYDRTKPDYTNHELYQISGYNSLIWEATGILLYMPSGGTPGMWAGDYKEIVVVPEHEEFWEEGGGRYYVWDRWGDLLQDLISGELRDLIDEEKLPRSYDGKPPDIEATFQLLAERVKDKVAMLDEWED